MGLGSPRASSFSISSGIALSELEVPSTSTNSSLM